jgi:hypothetical protein
MDTGLTGVVVHTDCCWHDNGMMLLGFLSYWQAEMAGLAHVISYGIWRFTGLWYTPIIGTAILVAIMCPLQHGHRSDHTHTKNMQVLVQLTESYYIGTEPH